MTALHVAFISVGSNLGDKLENCRRGIAELSARRDVQITGRSRFYKTEPVDFIAQDWFINAAVRIQTTLSPFALLDRLQTVQVKAGRSADDLRFGPRVLDLDLLLYDQLVLQDPRLSLPHPRMHRRRFVLKPLCDIDPLLVHPLIGKDIQSLLGELDEHDQQVIELR